MCNFELNSSESNSDLSLHHFVLPPLFHILENGTTDHPLSHPNKNLQVTLLFTFPLIQSIGKPWFYIETISQTCPFLFITLVVAMTTMQYPNWPPCFHSCPPTVHSSHRIQKRVSSSHFYNRSCAQDILMDSMILVIKHKLLITVNGSPHVLAPSIFPISFHTISLLSTLLFMPQTLQVYPYLLAFICCISVPWFWKLLSFELSRWIT